MNLRVTGYKTLIIILSFGGGLAIDVAAQDEQNFQSLPKAPSRPAQLSIAANQIPVPPSQIPAVTREQRQQSYAKLLEGQRYLWLIQNTRAQTSNAAHARMALQALQKSIEINPGLAESYTALAELFSLIGGKAGEIERLAQSALRLDRNNFGAHRLLARIYTRQSTASKTNSDKTAIDKAIKEWSEIARLDYRNAEAWAFLSYFYEQTSQTEKTLDALEKWSRAAAPTDERFYRSATGEQSLAPENARIRLGRALLRAGKTAAAIELLTRAVTETSASDDALSALQEAVENSTPAEAGKALEILRPAALAAPSNLALLDVLISAEQRAGRSKDAIDLLRSTIEKVKLTDKTTAANLLAKLAALYADEMRTSEAAAAYEEALKVLDIGNLPLATESDREFVIRVLPQLIALYRSDGKPVKAREAIARLRSLLGNTDPTADEQLIELLRASGEREAALQTVQDARRRFSEDLDLLRLQASILTDLGRIDEAVALLRPKIINKSKQISVPQTLVNDFSLNLTISGLYTQAGRGNEAIAAARQAMELSQSSQMTNIGLIALATAQNAAGDFKSAEENLREVIRQDSSNTTALNNLGYFLSERGERVPEAIALIKRAVEREPNNSSFLDSLGWAYFKSGQLAEAEKYLSAAARRNPLSVAVQDHLGDLYARQGKMDQAKTAWRKAISLSNAPTEIAKIKAKVEDSKKRP